MLNLIQDIGRMAVFGKLKVWLDAYSMLVKSVGGFLFGWIQFRWASVSHEEFHLLVIAAVACSAIWRAEYRYMTPERIVEKYTDAMHHVVGKVSFPVVSAIAATMLSAFYFLFAFIPALLLPDHWGVAAGALAFSLPFGVSFFNKSDDDRLAPGAHVRMELLGVLGVFVVLVAVNYAFLRTDGG